MQDSRPGLATQNLTGLASNQAELTIAELTSTQVDQLVLHQQGLHNIWQDWHRKGEATSTVWLVTGVFYTKQLDVANDVQHKITLASGDQLPSCPAALGNATPKLPPAAASVADATNHAGDTQTTPTSAPTPAPTDAHSNQPPASEGNPPTTTKQPSTPAASENNPPTTKNQNVAEVSGSATVGGVKITFDYTPSVSKKTTQANLVKGLAAASEVAATAAGQAVSAAVPVTVFAYSCRESNDIAHLVATIPVAIGVKVAMVGYFTHPVMHMKLLQSKPTDFTYDYGQEIPKFTNAR